MKWTERNFLILLSYFTLDKGYVTYLKSCTYVYISCPSIGVRAIFCQGGGGGKPFAQKTLASCPNFYKTVEQKRGPYDATCLNSYHAGAWHYRIFARTKDDYKFSTAKDPLFNSTGFCIVEDHCRQEHRCDCVCTESNLSYAGAKTSKGSAERLPGLFPSRKREMFVKGTECSELCGVKPSVLKTHAGEKGTSLYSVHVSQTGRCTWHSWLNYKVITPNCKHARRPNKFQKEAAEQVSPCKPMPFHILPMNLYMSWVVSI